MTVEFELARTQLPTADIYRHAYELPDHPALVGETTVTYGELLERVQQATARLAAGGITRGDRVALVAGNCVEFPILTYAVNYLGATIVPVNFRLSEGEIAYILGNCDPTIVITDAERSEVTKAAAGSTPVMDLGETTSPGDDPHVPDPVICDLNDDRAIMYTSGTTGRPKGAVLSYMNFLSTTTNSSISWGYVPGEDSVLIPSPMFHISAFSVFTTSIANAVTAIIPPSTGFDAAEMLDLMEAHGVTHTFGVPTQWQMIVDEQRRKPRELSLRFYNWGAAPATEELLTALRDTFPDAISQAAFGQTETTASGVSLGHEDSLRKLGSVGKANRNFAIRIVDAEMNDVPVNEVGEIVYRGPGVMSRFWNNEEATAEAFAGGWFHSGDLVRKDEDGFLYVVDRVKDMIVSGGENIYCAELENVIAWHPKVAEVSVVGRADHKWGEIPVAIVVPHDQHEPPTLEELRDFCEGDLARYKLPKDLIIQTALPRNGIGKIQKTTLRQLVSDRNVDSRLSSLTPGT